MSDKQPPANLPPELASALGQFADAMMQITREFVENLGAIVGSAVEALRQASPGEPERKEP